MMRERVSDDEPAVVVHEHAHVQPLRATQPEREDVRLPELVWCRALEATRAVLALRCRRRRLDQPLVVQDAAHLLLADTDCLEAREHVADPARAPVFVFTLQRDDLLARRRARL